MSKSKGNRGEIMARNLLREWTGKPFERVPQSGGLRWQGDADIVIGDLVCTDIRHRFPFTIEVKFYREVNFERLIYKPENSDLIRFWEQAKDEAKRAKKLPLLMVRYNGLPKDFFFVMIPLDTLQQLLEGKALKEKIMRKYPSAAMLQRKQDFAIIHPKILFESDYKKVYKCLRTKRKKVVKG